MNAHHWSTILSVDMVHILNYLQQNEITAKVYRQRQQFLPQQKPYTFTVQTPVKKES